MSKKRKPTSDCQLACYQKEPLKRGDIVRILPEDPDEREFWNHIAVVTWADPPDPKVHKGHPYRMHLLDHPYDAEIWLQHYERIGNAVEAVHLLESIRKKNP